MLKILNEYANLILVAITAIYAWLTYETLKVMRRQSTANIRISKVYLRVSVIGKKGIEKISTWKDLIKRPYVSLKDTTFIFKMFVDFVNISAGSGAIDQPKLLVRFKKSPFELEVRPTSERIGAARRTIIVSGGGFEKLDLDYFISFNENLIEHLKKFSEEMEYYIRYRDNSGVRHTVRINDVEGIK